MYTAEGDAAASEYYIFVNGQQVDKLVKGLTILGRSVRWRGKGVLRMVSISKEWFKRGDSYMPDISKDQDELPVLVLFFLLLVLALCFSGCSRSETQKDEKTKHAEDNITKIYYMETSEKGIIIPAIELNQKEKEFVFSYDTLSSYLPHGTYRVIDGLLYAATDDGKYQYIFEVVDEETLKFQQQGSAKVSLIDYRVGIKVTDQTIFKKRK